MNWVTTRRKYLYTDYFGFTEKPFENTLNIKMFYSSPMHEEALMRMLYVISERQGVGMLTGDYGSGKTILTRILSTQLNKNQNNFVFITNPQLDSVEMLKEIARQIAVVDKLPSEKSDLLNILRDVFKRNLEIGRNTVVIVDDAQLIKENETLEELRLLLNLQPADKFSVTLLLVGQTELREKINRIPQLKQRLAMKYHLDALNDQETGEYILYRLKISGRVDPLFTDLAIRAIYENTRGVPREINNICNWCLLAGFSKKVDTINKEVVEAIIKEMAV
ncbi:MAG: ATPase, T2SS/T4P/T4SS family [Candidatus Firestonebacteria bacterium]